MSHEADNATTKDKSVDIDVFLSNVYADERKKLHQQESQSTR